ncbi:MAG: tetratricopeptide repeat protein [Deltaproteobacteria bacterium]|nr:tetratricopeptide repeat protein [Deltaproteobacteria bacterium]
MCGAPSRAVKEDRKETVGADEEKEKKAVSDEDLTVRIVEVPKEPEFVAGVSKEAQLAFREGILAISKTPPDYEAARKYFSDAIDDDKEFLEAYFNLGMVYERIDKEEEALKVYNRAIKVMPENLEVRAYIGKIYLAKAKAEKSRGNAVQGEQLMAEAKKMFDEVLEKNPDDVASNNALALYWLMNNDNKTAEEFVKKVLSVQPKNVLALNTRGLINILTGRFEVAKWIFEQKVLKEDPNSVEAYNNLGITYLKLDKVPLAVENFQKALSLKPDLVPSRMNLGSIFLEYLNYQTALDQYLYVLKLDPENVEALIGCGASNVGLGKAGDAIKNYENALKVDPKRSKLYLRIADLYYKKMNDVPKAIEYYELYAKVNNLPATDPIYKTIEGYRQLLQMNNAPPPSEEPVETPAKGTEETGTKPEGQGEGL